MTKPPGFPPFSNRQDGADYLRLGLASELPTSGRMVHLWKQMVNISDFAGEADTEEDLFINTAFPSNPFPTGVFVERMLMLVNATFTGGSVSAATLQIGQPTVDPDMFLTAQAVGSGSPLGTKQSPTAGGLGFFFTNPNPALRLNTTGDNVSALTTGQVELFALYVQGPF